MKGIVFTGDRKLELQTFEDPTFGPGEVVLDILNCGPGELRKVHL